MYNVFVYGTLKMGYHNHRLLEGAEFKGIGVIHNYGVFGMPYGIPGVKAHEGSYVVGEIYSVDEKILERLDMLEGYRGEGFRDNMYNRKKEVAVLGSEEKLEVYFYEWNRAKPLGYDYIESGKWLRGY